MSRGSRHACRLCVGRTKGVAVVVQRTAARARRRPASVRARASSLALSSSILRSSAAALASACLRLASRSASAAVRRGLGRSSRAEIRPGAPSTATCRRGAVGGRRSGAGTASFRTPARDAVAGSGGGSGAAAGSGSMLRRPTRRRGSPLPSRRRAFSSASAATSPSSSSTRERALQVRTGGRERRGPRRPPQGREADTHWSRPSMSASCCFCSSAASSVRTWWWRDCSAATLSAAHASVSAPACVTASCSSSICGRGERH